ncbi:MAG: hypothetical protein GX326_03460 [Clostridiaceae bacterium]|nr:hypothetical protein [Clostridiaceae bacterium]
MFSLEAMLTVPLSLTVFIQGIVYLNPIVNEIETQTIIVAEERIIKEKNQHLYSINLESAITNLEVNPQKSQEIISLAHDLANLFLQEDN